VVALALAASAFAAGCPSGLSIAEKTALFNQYYYLGLCVAPIVAIVRRWVVPMFHSRPHAVHAYGLAAWLAVVAGASTFVREGLGYRLLPFNRATWQMVDVLTYGALAAVLGAMTLAMWLTLPRRIVARTGDAWVWRKRQTDVVAMPLRRAS
jgi:hypothetical protein